MLWTGKFTEELEELYDKYEEIFGEYPGRYMEIESSYSTMSYEEYVGYIKESIQQKRALPYVMFPDDFLTDEEWEEGNQLYQEYISVFGKPPDYYEDRERYKTVTEEEVDSVDAEIYLRECIAKKEKTVLSDALALGLEVLLFS